jgi:hypothetical protein
MPAIAANLLIAAWFFVMQSCEFTKTLSPGKTKIINLQGLIFQDQHRRVITHSDPLLLSAEFITLIFQDQKNGDKQDAQSQ